MAAKSKTWSELITDIDETVRKSDTIAGSTVEIDNDLPSRGRQKQYHSPQEREVRLRFRWTPPGEWRSREIRVDVRAAERAQDNLRLIAVALEMVRLAEVRGVYKLLGVLYRQMYPPPETPQPPPAGNPRQIPEHYALLHIEPNAPLAVAEAAYRALAKAAHPDAGGNTATMARLNAAIERIREEKK